MRRLALLALALAGCTKSSGPAKLTAPFVENFDRTELGDDWHNTGGPYRIQNGALIFPRHTTIRSG